MEIRHPLYTMFIICGLLTSVNHLRCQQAQAWISRLVGEKSNRRIASKVAEKIDLLELVGKALFCCQSRRKRHFRACWQLRERT